MQKKIYLCETSLVICGWSDLFCFAVGSRILASTQTEVMEQKSVFVSRGTLDPDRVVRVGIVAQRHLRISLGLDKKLEQLKSRCVKFAARCRFAPRHVSFEIQNRKRQFEILLVNFIRVGRHCFDSSALVCFSLLSSCFFLLLSFKARNIFSWPWRSFRSESSSSNWACFALSLVSSLWLERISRNCFLKLISYSLCSSIPRRVDHFFVETCSFFNLIHSSKMKKLKGVAQTMSSFNRETVPH